MGKQSNMATVQGGRGAVLCRVLKAIQANEDPSSFQNSCICIQRFTALKGSKGNSLLSSNIVREKKWRFNVLLVVLPTIKNTKVYPALSCYIYKSYILCFYC
jgi:hypothetical protein